MGKLFLMVSVVTEIFVYGDFFGLSFLSKAIADLCFLRKCGRQSPRVDRSGSPRGLGKEAWAFVGCSRPWAGPLSEIARTQPVLPLYPIPGASLQRGHRLARPVA